MNAAAFEILPSRPLRCERRTAEIRKELLSLSQGNAWVAELHLPWSGPWGEVAGVSLGEAQNQLHLTTWSKNQWYHFWIAAPPILVFFSGDWDVHWGCGVSTYGYFWPKVRACKGPSQMVRLNVQGGCSWLRLGGYIQTSAGPKLDQNQKAERLSVFGQGKQSKWIPFRSTGKTRVSKKAALVSNSESTSKANHIFEEWM